MCRSEETEPKHEGTSRSLDGLGRSDADHAAQWMAVLYSQVRSLAVSALKGERAGHTLNPTDLVHESYLRLSESNAGFLDENSFRAAAAVAIRRVLVDHARHRNRLRRKPNARVLPLDALEASDPGAGSIEEFLAIAELIDDLQRSNEQAATIVDLRLFGGMTFAEIALHVGLTERTVHNRWRSAKAWLRAAMSE